MTSSARIPGWDLLRGLCAIAVALYHLLMWQEIADLRSFGAYGVYMFFVLSGASLAYTYAPRLEQGRFSVREFLWVRYMRLAPLYIVLMLAVLPWKLLKEGLTSELLTKVALNAVFLFGFFDPAANSVLIGGWSLGVEAIYYLLFPATLVIAMGSPLVRFGGLSLLALLQAAWIVQTIGAPGGYSTNAVAYHQAPAFAAYFMGGCLLGLARRAESTPALPATILLPAIAAGFFLLGLLDPHEPGGELLGWRGAASAGLCIALVWLAGGVKLRRGGQQVAAHLGDATYGLYLMHPVLYFGVVWIILPKFGLSTPAEWSLLPQLALVAGVIGVSFLLALLSERYFERPVRDWSKTRARSRVHKELASSSR